MIRALPAALLYLASVSMGAAAERPDWAFFLPSSEVATAPVEPPPAAGGSWRAPGATRSYTTAELRDVLNPLDWYPAEHAPMPQIVAQGKRGAPGQPPQLPCALCHLPNGAGHVESASLAGLFAAYIVRQFADSRSGARRITVGTAQSMGFLT